MNVSEAPGVEDPLPIGRIVESYEDKLIEVKIAVERIAATVGAEYRKRLEGYLGMLTKNFAGLTAATLKMAIRAAATPGEQGAALQAALRAYIGSSWQMLHQIDAASREEPGPKIEIATAGDLPPSHEGKR